MDLCDLIEQMPVLLEEVRPREVERFKREVLVFLREVNEIVDKASVKLQQKREQANGKLDAVRALQNIPLEKVAAMQRAIAEHAHQHAPHHRRALAEQRKAARRCLANELPQERRAVGLLAVEGDHTRKS